MVFAPDETGWPNYERIHQKAQPLRGLNSTTSVVGDQDNHRLPFLPMGIRSQYPLVSNPFGIWDEV